MTTLTREAIEAASGGELDAMIGEHLMGWTRISSCGCGKRLRGWPPGCASKYQDEHLPEYSKSGDAMLTVLEKMREMGFDWDVVTNKLPRRWSVVCIQRSEGESDTVTEGNCLPEAVCRATLLAILSQKASA